MKTLLSILGIVTVLAMAAPATAQMKGGKKGHHQETGQSKKKMDDKGYKSALDRIPDQKFDPWGKVR